MRETVTSTRTRSGNVTGRRKSIVIRPMMGPMPSRRIRSRRPIRVKYAMRAVSSHRAYTTLFTCWKASISPHATGISSVTGNFADLVSAMVLIHQLSPNGRTSSSKDQADRFCCVNRKTLSATSSDLTKKASGFPGIFARVLGKSMTPSTITRAT